MESQNPRLAKRVIIEEVSSVLGIVPRRVEVYLQISGFEEPVKEVIRQKKITGNAAAVATGSGVVGKVKGDWMIHPVAGGRCGNGVRTVRGSDSTEEPMTFTDWLKAQK